MALHRFRARALSLILRSPLSFPASHGPPIFSLDRLLCSAATSSESTVSSPPSFAAEDYLISRCGLTPVQAAKASKKVSHFTSCSKPDSVLAFLGGTLGLPAADITALIAREPSFLCVDVERTVAPRVAELSELGLSREEIAQLVALAPYRFRGTRFLRRSFEFWLKELGSFDKLLQAVRQNTSILCSDLDKCIIPNVALLRQCGLSVSELDALTSYSAWLYTKNPKHLQESVEQLEELGVKRGTRMFARALIVISLMSKESVISRIQFLRKSGFSHDDVRKIVRKAPSVLGMSDKRLQESMDFLMKDVGLDFTYIAQRAVLLMYSVERRLLPRYCLLKVLREKALLKTEWEYYTTASMSEKKFLQKFVLAYEDTVPGLADSYASKCFGKAGDKVALQVK